MKAQEKMKKENSSSFMKNVAMLMIAQILIKILGFVYRLVIINIEGFGDIGNGYYDAGYTVYSLLLTLSSVGIPTIISKLVSERVATGDHKGAYRIFKTSLKIFTLIGAFFSLVLFFGADIIARKILNVPDVKYVLMVLAPAIMFVASSAVLRGYFAGLGSMKSTSVSQTLEQFFNCVLTITFVYALVGKDPAIMAAGGNLSTTLAILISFTYLVIFYKRRRKGIMAECEAQTVEQEDKTTGKLIKTIFAISIPMTIGSLISVINNMIDTVTISNCIQTAFSGILEGGKAALEAKAMELSGVLSKVVTIIHLPLAITGAFCTALVPAISSAISVKDYATVNKRLSFSFFASILLIMPCAAGLVALAEPILKLIYPAASNGANILVLSTITMIFVSLNYVVEGGLYGFGKVHIPAIALAIGGVVKLILNIILISNPEINILGAVISSIACQVILFVICMYYLNKEIKLNMNLKDHVLKPTFASAVMGIIVYIVYKVIVGALGNAISTIIAICLGAIIYLLLVIFMKMLTKEEIYMIPFGTKIYNLLVKLKVYKEN